MISKQFMVRGVGLLVAIGICWSLSWESHGPPQERFEAHPLRVNINFRTGKLRRWALPFPEDWEILSSNGFSYLHMLRARPPGIPRRPLQFALLKNIRVGSFDLQARVRRLGGSIIVVFNYEDTLHFYYAHLSKDPGSFDSHNGIFIVDGEPRRRIAGKSSKPALPDRAWHTVRIVRDLPSGAIKVFMDHDRQPLFSVVDRTFTCGEVGFGSFGDTGDFADIRLRSHDSGCQLLKTAQ